MISDESWTISPNAESSSSCRGMEVLNHQIIFFFRRNEKEVHSGPLCLETYRCNQLRICFFCEVGVGAATIENYSSTVATPSIETQWAASIIYPHNLCLIKISEIIKLKWLKINEVQRIKYNVEFFHEKGIVLWYLCFSAVLWGIWLERNMRTFRGVEGSDL